MSSSISSFAFEATTVFVLTASLSALAQADGPHASPHKSTAQAHSARSGSAAPASVQPNKSKTSTASKTPSVTAGSPTPVKSPAAKTLPVKPAVAKPSKEDATPPPTSQTADNATPPKTLAVTEVYKLPEVTANAAQVATLLNGLSISGVSQVLVTSNNQLVFLLNRAAYTNTAQGSRNARTGSKKVSDVDPLEKLKSDLSSMVTNLAGLKATNSALVTLPDDANTTDLRTSALRVPGIATATAIGDHTLLLTYDNTVRDATNFVNEIRRPPLPDKHVDSFAQRLYYIDGSAGKDLAAVIDNMYPDVTAQFIEPDVIQLSMKHPPDHHHLYETDTIDDARRALATIDQPRPRASLDAWAIQIASNDYTKLEVLTPKIEQATSAYNEVMNQSILNGWRKLTLHPKNLDSDFDEYISHTTMARPDAASTGPPCCYTASSRFAKAETLKQGYALGYETMFDPVTPNLVDMLVSLVAQKNPRAKAKDVLQAMEGDLSSQNSVKLDCKETCKPESVTLTNGLGGSEPGLKLCRQMDTELYQNWVEAKQHECGKTCKGAYIVVPPALTLSCVRQELEDHLFRESPVPLFTSEFGQMRAAVADFLFHYKLMKQYPDDFDAYLEPMSADTLDMALLPIVDAFYDDLGAFQETMQEQIYGLLQRNGVSYSSSGLVSMKMIAGTTGIVNSTSQNDFQSLEGASAADFAEAIASIKTDPVSAASKLLKLTTPTPVTASLGKELNLTSTVHSLSGAYGMELDLHITSAENGTPELVKSGTTTTKTDDLNSRVTTHELQTKVRVDSLKLFEVSTARSLVTRGQAPWAPVDPFFEIPVISQFVKRPRKPKAVYTQSLLFIDALVIPTAIDLGYGTPFTEDVIYSPANNSHKAYTEEVDSLRKLDTEGVRFAIQDFHNQTLNCLVHEYLSGGQIVSKCDEPSNKPQWRPQDASPAVSNATP